MLGPFSDRRRRKRMEMFTCFLADCGIKNPRILDLGGQPEIWENMMQPVEITIINLPGIVVEKDVSIHEITYIEGDACNVDQYKDNSFDIVFSNSVIEHVGDVSKQQDFAKEVHRLAQYFWIQTPSKYFPLEAHCGMPFWWYWPKSLRQRIIKRWSKKLPAWTEMVEGTTVLSREQMEELFPSAIIKTERTFGFVKSYIACGVNYQS